jgi:hypothetical protein
MGLFDCFRCKAQVYLKHEVLFPGNVVEGFVQFDVNSPVDVVGIRLKICGKEKTTLVVQNPGQQGNNVNSKSYYHGKAVVLKQLLTLAGNMKASQNHQHMTVPAGKYTYPFQFQLPIHLPPSFYMTAGDGDCATILYYVKAYVDIPSGKDVSVKRHFKVLSGIPHHQWVARAPVGCQKQFNITCCLVNKGVVNARFFMDRSVIAIDRDNLFICVDVDNTQGQEPVESAEVSLVNYLEYRAMGRREVNRVLAGNSYIKQRVEVGQKGRIQGVVPLQRNLVPSCTGFNSTSRYSVILELNIPWASDPSMEFPVILAHVVDDSNVLPPAYFQQCQFRMMPPNSTPEYFYMPPPTPVFPYSPAPLPPPHGAPMFQPQPPLFAVLPPQQANWGGTGFDHPPQPQLAWGQGQPMQYMQMAPPPPPPPLGAYDESPPKGETAHAYVDPAMPQGGWGSPVGQQPYSAPNPAFPPAQGYAPQQYQQQSPHGSPQQPAPYGRTHDPLLG